MIRLTSLNLRFYQKKIKNEKQKERLEDDTGKGLKLGDATSSICSNLGQFLAPSLRNKKTTLKKNS